MTRLDTMTEHISFESLLQVLLICVAIVLSDLLNKLSHKHDEVVPLFINQRFELEKVLMETLHQRHFSVLISRFVIGKYRQAI